MKSSVTKIIIFIIILAAIYTAFFSVIKLEEGNFGVVLDLRYNRIVKTFNKRYNFVFEGAMPWWYSTDSMSIKRSINLDVRVPIPELEGLHDDIYSIKIPVAVVFSIDTDRFFNYESLNGNCRELNNIVTKYIANNFLKEFQKYISPVYRKNILEENIGRYIDTVIAGIRNRLNSSGLRLDQFDITGNVVTPDVKTYFEGLRFLGELRSLEMNNRKEMKSLLEKLNRDRVQQEHAMKKLGEISKLIRDNPLILKYIYIDKMASGVKVILSSDSSGFPGFLNDISPKTESKNNEIDNLK